MRFCEVPLIRFVVLIFTAVLLFTGCKKEADRFSISGKISHAEGKVLYLEELLVSSSKVTDSTKIDKRGEFKFEGTTTIPTYYLLKFNDNKFITLLVDSLENVVVEADIANFERDYSIKGSEGSAQVKMLNDHLYDTKHKLDSLKSLINLYRGNPDFERLLAQSEEEAARIRKEQIDFSTKFVMDNPFSMASILALYQKFDNQYIVLNDLQEMRDSASALNSIYP
mgnify:CR=1 FL=1